MMNSPGDSISGPTTRLKSLAVSFSGRVFPPGPRSRHKPKTGNQYVSSAVWRSDLELV